MGAYPNEIDSLIPEQLNALPISGSASIPAYTYELNGDAYDVSFRQCTFFICWNPLIYIYNPQDNQQGYGEFPTLQETRYPHWRYFYFD